jgi:hypothetical protein
LNVKLTKDLSNLNGISRNNEIPLLQGIRAVTWNCNEGRFVRYFWNSNAQTACHIPYGVSGTVQLDFSDCPELLWDFIVEAGRGSNKIIDRNETP